MFIEQTRPEEWIKISGILTSRIVLPPLTEKNQQQICLLDRAQGIRFPGWEIMTNGAMST